MTDAIHAARLIEIDTMISCAERSCGSLRNQIAALLAEAAASPRPPEITDEMISAGAQALRLHEQGHRVFNPWALMPKGQRKPWLEKARVVLEAALWEADDVK